MDKDKYIRFDWAVYDRHVDAIMIQNNVLGTEKFEGLLEGCTKVCTEAIFEVV